jgi:hypothetical protein
MKVLKIEDNTARKIYKTADAELKMLLEENFGVSFFSQKITDRVKTWEDVLEISGRDEEDILPYFKPRDKRERSINAFAKIQLISEVLNQDWTADLNNHNQYKWYPWFEKKSSGWVLTSDGYSISFGSSVGSGFFYKSEELALFAGKTFIDIYNDYLP